MLGVTFYTKKARINPRWMEYSAILFISQFFYASRLNFFVFVFEYMECMVYNFKMK